jgi:hypothetical protein
MTGFHGTAPTATQVYVLMRWGDRFCGEGDYVLGVFIARNDALDEQRRRECVRYGDYEVVAHEVRGLTPAEAQAWPTRSAGVGVSLEGGTE